MAAIDGLAPAKINLTLHVTGRRADGYHLLESLVVFAGIGDRLKVEPAEDLTLAVDGPAAEGVPADGGNLVLRAAERLRDLRGVGSGARITLEKHLPHGGGIGGGSSDAATVLGLLATLWGVEPLDAAEALPLGADLPVCLHAPRPALLRGIGELVTAAPPLPRMWLLLVNPGVAVATDAVFQRFRESWDFSTPEPDPEPWDDPRGFFRWLNRQRNDLAPVVGRSVPEVAEAGMLVIFGDEAASGMSGSGSTCWALYRDEPSARAAAERVAAARPGWWVRAARVLK